MGIIKKIFARIWALWGLISFVITFLIFLIPSLFTVFLPELKSQRIFIIISQIWMRIWLSLIGCPLRIYGKENFEKGENYVVVFNHNALLDVPLSSPFVPGANKTIAKKSFAKIPVFGWYYSKGSVLVDRKNEISRRKSYEEMKRVLAMGMHMIIYPEGTRNRTDQPLKSFYDGAFKLSVDTGKAVVPAVIRGTREAMPIKETFYLLPKKLSITYLPPVHPMASGDALKQTVFSRMEAELRK